MGLIESRGLTAIFEGDPHVEVQAKIGSDQTVPDKI